MPDGPVNVLEFEALAQAAIDPMTWDYYASGANDEITLRRNRAAWEEVALHYRVMVDVSTRDITTTVLGHEISMPLCAAPTAFHQLAHPDGELATARAVGRAGTLMMLSSLSNTAVEEVVAATSAPVLFQLYVYRDRSVTEGLVERVAAAGCRAIVVTVDAPLLGRRERDVRNQFHLPEGFAVRNLLPAGYGRIDERPSDSGLAAYFGELLDPALTWKDIAWLQSITDLPVVVKGLVRADDARRAADAGAAGIVVSNHGGRQLDTSPATIEVLPRIVDAVGDRLDVLVDGGVRRGVDVIKAVAYGAKAAMIGRPILWGLGVGGQAGVERVFQLLRDELDLAMALCGCRSIADVTRDLVEPPF
jgi:4-hydroxymandelate oxidase